MPTINLEETGKNIKELMKTNGVTVVALQEIMGFGTPQAIYKWFKGSTMPTLDNFVLLAFVLDTTIDKVLVLDK